MDERTRAQEPSIKREAKPMPGGRLTHADRRQLAAWLSDRLTYAEIARRLGRPTSTISREVLRNGGPGCYLADGAQRATEHRTHRRKPVPASESPHSERATEAVRGFVDQFATLLAGTGLPRMMARVFVCLLTSGSGSLTAAELVQRLRVSPASVSKAIGYLEATELVRREPDPSGRRRERYIVGDDVWLRAWRADTGAHAQVADAARRGIEIFGADTPAGTRLGQMGEFFAWLSQQMDDGGLAETLLRDAQTVVAALVYAARPLAVDELAVALGWPVQRAGDALGAIEHRPIIADPLAVRRSRSRTYTIVTRPDRLSPAQRAALRATGGP